MILAFRSSLEKRREDIKGRWEMLEARRRARLQYYRAKIHHERSNNSTPAASANQRRDSQPTNDESGI